MKKLLPSYVLIVIWSCSLSAAEVQSGPALLRMERVQTGEAVCVLVKDDGSYRLEKLFRAKTEMYTGQLEAAQLERLRSLLRDDELRKLSQSDIHTPLLVDSVDNIDLSIWRDRGWQNLAFHSSQDRKPFHDAIDPLLSWFQDVRKQRPGATTAQGSATRCVPDKSSNLVSTDASVPSPPKSNFLFFLRSRDFDRGVLESKCTIVFPDGSYRLKWRKRSFSGANSEQGAGGQIDAAALQELNQILESPDLTSASTEGTPVVLSGTQLQGVFVEIPRAKQMQRLEFVREFNHAGSPREIGGMSNLSYRATDQRVLDPLKRWMKENTEKHDKPVEEKAPGNDCGVTDGGVADRGTRQ